LGKLKTVLADDHKNMMARIDANRKTDKEEMMEKMDANQAKSGAERKTYQVVLAEMKADRKAYREDLKEMKDAMPSMRSELDETIRHRIEKAMTNISRETHKLQE
jgi:hypothetical protein